MGQQGETKNNEAIDWLDPLVAAHNEEQQGAVEDLSNVGTVSPAVSESALEVKKQGQKYNRNKVHVHTLACSAGDGSR